MKRQKGAVQVLFLVIAALVVVGAGIYYYLTVNKNNGAMMPAGTNAVLGYQTDYLQGAKDATAVKSGADLKVASSALDGTDLTQIDKGLSVLSADSSSF